MHRITRGVIKRTVDAFGLDLRAQPAMHEPLLKPDCLQRAGCHFTQQGSDVWATKSTKTILRGVAVVGVAFIERRAESGKNQEAVKVSLEEHIDVYPLPNVASISHITRRGIEAVGRLVEAALNREPGVEVSHVIHTGNGSSN